MAWSCLVSGINVLTYWETYVACLEYFAFFIVPIIIYFLISKRRQGSAPHIRYLRRLFLHVLHAIAVSVFVLTLFPIMLSLAEQASWDFPWKVIFLVPEKFSWFMGILVTLAVILSLTPAVNTLQPFQTLVLGSASLVFVQIILDILNPTIDMQITDLFPGFLFMIGLIVISVMLTIVSRYASNIADTVLRDKLNMEEGIRELLLFPLAAIFGFIPVFMYGACLA